MEGDTLMDEFDPMESFGSTRVNYWSITEEIICGMVEPKQDHKSLFPKHVWQLNSPNISKKIKNV